MDDSKQVRKTPLSGVFPPNRRSLHGESDHRSQRDQFEDIYCVEVSLKLIAVVRGQFPAFIDDTMLRIVSSSQDRPVSITAT
jgi:hypothetical protein